MLAVLVLLHNESLAVLKAWFENCRSACLV